MAWWSAEGILGVNTQVPLLVSAADKHLGTLNAPLTAVRFHTVIAVEGDKVVLYITAVGYVVPRHLDP